MQWLALMRVYGFTLRFTASIDIYAASDILQLYRLQGIKEGNDTDLIMLIFFFKEYIIIVICQFYILYIHDMDIQSSVAQ